MSDDEAKSDCSEVNISDLKKQRGVIKGRLTLLVNFIKKLDSSCLDSVSKTQIQLRLESAASFFSEFNVIQSKIEKNVDEEELLVQSEYRETFECQYFSVISTAKCMINDDQSEFNNSKCAVEKFSKPLNVKLPQIQLPTFDGSYDKWL